MFKPTAPPISVDPKVYHLDHHRIRPEQIDEHACYVIEKLKQTGHKAYLVGGGVRDLLLNVPPKDFDISTSATPEEIKAIFKRNALIIGRRFRLVHVRFGKKILEVSTFRSGNTESSDLILRDNEWGTEEEDVLRRDFTINGLFYDPSSETVIDYVDGYADLEKKTLRTIGQPCLRFQQDPVRMIRLLKFCARFDFHIEKETLEALVHCKQSILQSSSVRVFEELCRMLESGSAKPFFHLLHQYGLLDSLIPELAYFLEKKNETTSFELLELIDIEIKRGLPKTPERALLFAILLFPLIESFLKEVTKKQEKVPHLGEIAAIISHALDCIFLPFFNLPKKTRAQLNFILTSQFRFIPLDGVLPKRIRLPNEPLVGHAVYLFKLRAEKEPDLLELYQRLASMKAPSSDPVQYTGRYRRRRRRP